ncbi:MAG: hypothetical protein GY950_08505 [bacterium]|nr:hypothetical protein [bacterium]
MVKRFILTLTVLMMVFFINCGKKGPLKLEPEILPKKAENVKISQVGDNIRLRWDFPRKLSDKKTEFDPQKLTRVEVYYSEKEILGGKFRKKSTLMRKLKLTDISPYHQRFHDPNLMIRWERSTSHEKEKRKKFAYFVDLPFNIKDLTSKQHFFALRYLYGKKKSPISKVVFLVTQTPVKPVENLKINKEKKLVKLQWSKPQTDVSGTAVANIAGYKISRKIKHPKSAAAETEPGEEPFRKINSSKVLVEYYADGDTGTDGEYLYHVATVITNDIESAPSAVVSVDITDTYPPDIPVNLVTFKASDHMFLTWKQVRDPDFSHYRVYRKSNNEQEFALIADKIDITQYKDKNIQKGTVYYYVVTAVDTKGNESDFSNSVNEEF